MYKSNITELAAAIKNWRVSKKFHTPSSIDTVEDRDAMLGKLMLVVTEIAEAAEAVRHHDKENFEEELADTIIRLLDISSAMDIDIGAVLEKKMMANEKREPRHGKATSL